MWLVQDIVAPYSNWPEWIKDLLKSPTFIYIERIKLLTFFFVNGVREADLVFDFLLKIKGSRLMMEYKRTIDDIYKYLKDEKNQHRYFSYCVDHEHYEYLDGEERSTKG